MYPKEDGSIAIIIAGRERGPIWMEEEYNDPSVNINLTNSYYMEKRVKGKKIKYEYCMYYIMLNLLIFAY